MKATLFLAAAFAAALGGAATAQDGPPESVRQIVVYGDDPCPQAEGEDIVICARKPESERFRIPEELRTDDSPEGESWASRAQAIEYVGRTGLNSCSTVGPGGFTGCWQEMVRQAREERRQNGDAPQP